MLKHYCINLTSASLSDLKDCALDRDTAKKKKMLTFFLDKLKDYCINLAFERSNKLALDRETVQKLFNFFRKVEKFSFSDL